MLLGLLSKKFRDPPIDHINCSRRWHFGETTLRNFNPCILLQNLKNQSHPLSVSKKFFNFHTMFDELDVALMKEFEKLEFKVSLIIRPDCCSLLILLFRYFCKLH